MKQICQESSQNHDHRRHDFQLKMHQKACSGRAPPGPTGERLSSPDSLAAIRARLLPQYLLLRARLLPQYLLLREARDREGKEEGKGEARRGRERTEGKERGERKEVGGREEEGRKGKDRSPVFLFYESTTGMVPIMGPIQTLCTRAPTELATPLP